MRGPFSVCVSTLTARHYDGVMPHTNGLAIEYCIIVAGVVGTVFSASPVERTYLSTLCNVTKSAVKQKCIQCKSEQVNQMQDWQLFRPWSQWIDARNTVRPSVAAHLM